jgi:hypothetical protein
VRQPRVEAPAILLDAHQTPTLEGVEVDLVLHSLEKLYFEGLTEGQHLERVPPTLVEPAQPSPDDLHEAG